jgi:hypothetical protein
MRAAPSTARPISALLRGEPDAIDGSVRAADGGSLARHVAVIVVGAGLFGAAMGAWRSPDQALFTAVKFPLIVLLTTLGNALLNGMLAPLLGLNLRLRESLRAVALGFTVAALILGALAPLLLFLVWNAPPLEIAQRTGSPVYQVILLASVLAIAVGGIVGVSRLYGSLRRLGGNAPVAGRVLFAWLAGNLLLGAQLSWNLRPFIGSPHLPVQFLRPNAFDGNFYEAVLRSFTSFFIN